jgi:hypothetical protein
VTVCRHIVIGRAVNGPAMLSQFGVKDETYDLYFSWISQQRQQQRF